MTTPTSSSSSGPTGLGGVSSGIDTAGLIQKMLGPDNQKITDLQQKEQLNSAKVDTWNQIALQLQSLATAVSTLKADNTGTNTLFENKVATPSVQGAATVIASTTAVAATHTLSINQLARQQVVYGTQNPMPSVTAGAKTFILNGKTFNTTIDANTTVSDIANLINNHSYTAGKELQANVIDNRLVVQTKNTGTASTISGALSGPPAFTLASDDPNNLLQQLGIITEDLPGSPGTGKFVNVAQTSADAQVVIDGIPVTSGSNVLTNTIRGVTINLQRTGDPNLTVTIASDTTAIKQAINEFVDQYNATRALIQNTQNIKLNPNDQFGPFFSDSLLRDLYSQVRTLTTGGVKLGGDNWAGVITAQSAASQGASQITLQGFTTTPGTLNVGEGFNVSGDPTTYKLTSAAAIAGGSATVGIIPPLVRTLTTGTAINVAVSSLDSIGVGVRTDTVSGVAGVLGVIDSAKLDNALTSNFDAVKNLFKQTGTSGNAGVATRLYNWIDRQTKISAFSNIKRSIDDVKIPNYNSQNTDLANQIIRLQAQIVQKQKILTLQFANMESAISRSQRATSSLSNLSKTSTG